MEPKKRHFLGDVNIITGFLKNVYFRSIVLHATLRLIPLLKQLRKGLQVYNFVDILQDHCGLCQHFFVPTAADEDSEVSFILILSIFLDLFLLNM